jgi:nucleoside-diphosphate-sugar epimerase
MHLARPCIRLRWMTGDRRRRVLVCGATGFIGRNVAEALARRDDLEVYGTRLSSPPYQHPGITLVRCDLRQPAEVERVLAGVDVVVQAAAVTSGARDIVSRPWIHVTDNAIMNSVLFRAAHERGVAQVVFLSCSIMYPSRPEPLCETDFDASQLPPSYFGIGWTKVYLERMCEFYARLGGTRYTVVRHSNVYGPYDKFDLERSHVFGATMTKVLTASDGRLSVWGDGREARDLLYVSDLVDYVSLAIDRQTTLFELHNVGSGHAVSVDELVRRIISHSGRRLTIDYDATRPTLPTSLCLDSTRARSTFGWTPAVSLDEGIRRTMAWYRQTHLSAATGG